MSLLINESYAGPSTPLWLSATPGGPGGDVTFSSVTTTGAVTVGTNATIDTAAYFLDASNNPTAAINNNSGVLALSGTSGIDFKQVGVAGGNSSITLRPLGGQDILTTGLVDCDGLTLANTGGAATVGTATLTAGQATVNTTASENTCYIFLQRRDINGSTALGELRVTQRNANSFVVVAASLGPSPAPTTTETNDVSTFDWMIINPA